jgi:N-sulfoglucosamine sulfohydrolase
MHASLNHNARPEAARHLDCGRKTQWSCRFRRSWGTPDQPNQQRWEVRRQFPASCITKHFPFIIMLLLLLVSGTHAAGKKNVLLLVSDNHTFTDMGCYGHPNIRTPHLDALAARGTRFSHAFATTASCGPSRAVIYTGLLTHANGQYTHSHSFHNGVLAKHVTTVFDLHKSAGYRTALFGKTSVGTRGGQYEIDAFDETLARDLPGQAKAAGKFIAEGGGNPFLIVLATHDPHPSDKPAAQRWKDKLFAPRRIDPAEVVVPAYLPDRPDVRESLAEYHELIERLDAGFGEALAMLRRTGHDEDTLVIFFADHGCSYPGAEAAHWEPAVHVPFIVSSPAQTKRGVTTDAIVTLADVTPTILEWTGAKGPSYELHGRSVLGVLDQETATGWDSAVLSHFSHEITMPYPMRTLRERRYKMIWNINYQLPFPLPSEVAERSPWAETIRRGDKLIGRRAVQDFLWHPPVELYDLQTDPDEVINLADDPKHADLRREMSEKLLKRLRDTGDLWLERYQLPMPGEKVHVTGMSPKGYAPSRSQALRASKAKSE